jgi:hypothetical protein
VRQAVEPSVADGSLERPQIGSVHLEQLLTDRCVDLLDATFDGELCDLEEDLPGQRVPVGVQPGRRQPDQHVPGTDRRPVQNVAAIDQTDDKARDVVLPFSVKPGHLGGLPTEKRAVVLAAATGEPLDDRRQDAGLEPPGGDVVQEEERACTLDENVVDAVVDEILTHGAVHARGKGDLELGSDPVRRGHQDGGGHTRKVGREQPAERPQIRQDSRGSGRVQHRLDTPQRFVLRVDVDTGVPIGQLRSIRVVRPATVHESSGSQSGAYPRRVSPRRWRRGCEHARIPVSVPQPPQSVLQCALTSPYRFVFSNSLSCSTSARGMGTG